MMLRRYHKKQKAETSKEEEQQPEEMTVPELKELAKEKGIEGFNNMRKQELLEALEEGE